MPNANANANATTNRNCRKSFAQKIFPLIIPPVVAAATTNWLSGQTRQIRPVLAAARPGGVQAMLTGTGRVFSFVVRYCAQFYVRYKRLDQFDTGLTNSFTTYAVYSTMLAIPFDARCGAPENEGKDSGNGNYYTILTN